MFAGSIKYTGDNIERGGGQKPSSGQSGKDWAKDVMNKQYSQGWDKDPHRMMEYSKLKKYGIRHDK